MVKGLFGKGPSRMPLTESVTRVAWLRWGLWVSSNLGLQQPWDAINLRSSGQLSVPLTVAYSRARYKQNACWKAFNPYARFSARKLLEADGKENKRAFPALHRLKKAEFSWPRDRKVLRSPEERILIEPINSRDIIITPKGMALDNQARGNTKEDSPLKDKTNYASSTNRARTRMVLLYGAELIDNCWWRTRNEVRVVKRWIGAFVSGPT